MCKRAYCKYFKIFADGSYRYELRDWNHGPGYGCLEPEARYSIGNLWASPAPILIPSLTHCWNSVGGSFLLGKHQWSFSFADRERLGSQMPVFPPCFEGFPCPGLLHCYPSNIWPVPYWGDAGRDLAVTGLTEVNGWVHTADLKKTALHQIKARLSVQQVLLKTCRLE